MKQFGIDVSAWQDDFNFQKAINEGVKFAVIRGGGGDDGYYTDSKFLRNYSECKKLKLPVGVYWFSRALTTAQAKAEAEYFYNNVLKGRQFELPVYIDVENKRQLAVGKRLLTDIIKTWCNTLSAKGYYVGIYSSLSTFNDCMYDDELTSYAHWVAQWAKSCRYTQSCMGMWQFGGETNPIRSNKVAGKVCDQDYMTVDYPTLIKNAGKNGYKKSSSADADTAVKSSDQTMSDIEKLLRQARTYIGKNGEYVCKTKLGMKNVVDWCAYSISAIMKDCGFIGKYQGGIYGYASDAAREDHDKYGEWFRKGTKSPQPGDYIMFKYASFTNPLDKYSASHVGIVESVSGNVITTLEGNVDGYGSNWAGTSTFKRKTRYLSSSDVYAFYRPYWQGENKATSTNSAAKTSNSGASTSIDVTYQVHLAGGSWLPDVKNLTDFAGLENRPIDGIRASVSKGHIRCRVKLIGSKNYLPWVTDREDYAGIYGRQIDCVQMELYGADGYTVEYRVSTAKSKNYLEWVRHYNTKNEDGYAGLVGAAIDKLQIMIVKSK